VDLPGSGPEDVVVDERGRVVTGLEDGRILRLDRDGGAFEPIAGTGGRPLGIEVLPDGGLLVCDARLGLLRVDAANGHVETLVAAGEHGLRLCNNAAVAADGTVYFSDSSQRFDLEHWKADLLESSATGRLLRRRPTGEVDTVVGDLRFANGVALAVDESYVVVAETGGYCLTRLWLVGPRAGTVDVLVDNLPGFADNISTGTDGLIWIAVANPRDRLLDRLVPLPGAVRRAIWALPERLHPRPTSTVWVMAVDGDGRTVHDFHASCASFGFVTGVREHHGTVHLGSLTSTAIAHFAVPGATPEPGAGH
jgi:sugar lactone lactonase YvrE